MFLFKMPVRLKALHKISTGFVKCRLYNILLFSNGIMPYDMHIPFTIFDTESTTKSSYHLNLLSLLNGSKCFVYLSSHQSTILSSRTFTQVFSNKIRLYSFEVNYIVLFFVDFNLNNFTQFQFITLLRSMCCRFSYDQFG
jgi:hypothetical protein